MPDKPIVINSGSEYPNASFRNKPNDLTPAPKAKQQPEAVISSDRVKVRKPSAWKRVRHKLLADDGEQIKSYIVDDVLVPTIKNTISEVGTNVLDILLFGETRRRTTGVLSGGNRNGNYVYRSTSTIKPASPRPSNTITSVGLRNSLALDEFIFETRADADTVLEYMSTAIDDYGMVSVLDFYGWCGRVCPATYDNYIWTDLSSVKIQQTRYFNDNEGRYMIGYVIYLPTPHLKE